MFDILNYCINNDKYNNVVDLFTTKKNPIFLNSANNIHKLLVINYYLKTSETIVVVYPNIYEATLAYEDYLELLGADKISFFPVDELVASSIVAASNSYRLHRIKTIYSILNNENKIIITTLEGISRKVVNKDIFLNAIINFNVGVEYNRTDIINKLVNFGYTKTPVVETPGTFSVRGSVIDIYPINYELPLRLDFFDNELETIKIFNVDTQRSKEKIDNACIYPFFDMLYLDSNIKDIINRINNLNIIDSKKEEITLNIINRNNIDSLYLFIDSIDPLNISFFELLSNSCNIYINLTKILEHEKYTDIDLITYLNNIYLEPISKFSKSTLEIIKSNSKNVFFESFSTKYEEITSDYILDLATSNNVDYNNYLTHLVEELKLNSEKTYIISHYDEAKLKLIKDLLDVNNIKYICNSDKLVKNKVNLVVSNNALGFVDYELNVEIITPKQFAKGKIYKKSKYQAMQDKTVQIYNKEDLDVFDYVVHEDYGIGKYLGIKTIETKGVKNDYLMLEYNENSKLYVPIDQVYKLQKYIGSVDKIPKLSKLNTKEWEKKKARVKEKLLEVAKNIIDTQAKRELLQGYIYNKDSEEQLKFENDFDFIETPDQIKAIEDIKKDMESTKPVDRLICGDVGFGKTEVALRAAFKAVDNGKQVAVLAPTTVLSRQHYFTFKERCEKYGVRVELLNRFVEKKDLDIVLDGLKRGYVDIVIGTHRLLSKDIEFKNLGMLIIDEEQRFGVEHKEKIKQMKANIDIISMSATPIPRTLQMSLSGIKEMSLIETPPINRKSIQTYVLEKNDSVIRDAIHKEMARSGQIFYLLNKISELDKAVSKIKRLVPKANIGVIHGRMDKDDIEDVLNNFLEKNYDVLVCTTIIETGIDIPNANTLIVEKANHLGLAQLYQIRGRIGRSEQLAYAYLMYETDSILTDVAYKRLNAIKEFTSLGSGYKIAMRDLSIRGAGDVLGIEQSGYIDDIGIDLYLQMLDDAINEQKGIVKEEKEKPNYDLKISKTINSDYVSEDVLKIMMHQEINKIYSKEQAIDILQEFSDRYGSISNELKVYIYSKYLETLLKQKGIENYKIDDFKVEFNFDVESTNKIKFIQLLKLTNDLGYKWDFQYKQKKIYITIPLNKENSLYSDASFIYQLMNLLEKM